MGQLQVALKYHVYSDSLWAQITEHTEYNYVMAALYRVGEELENLMRTDKQRTDTQRIQNLRPLLSPWIVGVSGPIQDASEAASDDQVIDPIFLLFTNDYDSPGVEDTSE